MEKLGVHDIERSSLLNSPEVLMKVSTDDPRTKLPREFKNQ